jgi:tetratricopeptide (TPR) repeat protein
VWARRCGTALCLSGALTASPLLGAEDPLSAPIVRETPAGKVELRPVPLPDLSRAEPDVRDTLTAARANLAATLSAPGARPRDLADAYGVTGAHYLAYKIWEAAESCYLNARALAQDDYRWPYYLGYRYVQDSRLDLAAEGFARALTLRPDYLPARVRLGLVQLELDRADLAEPHLEAALADPPLRAAALFGLGRAALARGDPARAAGYLESALDASPDASRIHYPLGMAYRALGRVDDARTHLSRRGEGDPRLPDPLVDDLAVLLTGSRTHFYRGVEALRDGHFDVAVEGFSQGLARQPDNVNARVSLARARYLAGDRDAARRELDTALEQAPGHDLALFLRGTLADEEGDRALAEDCYRRAIAAAPGHGGAHHFLASARMRAGRYGEAAEHYAAAVAAVPKNGPARLYAALALVRAGEDHRAAREGLEAAVAELPEDAMLRQALARLLAASPDDRVRDGPRALGIAQALFDGFGSLEHAETLAMALAETGRTEDARSLQEKALEAARAAGRFDLVPRVEENLALYREGRPCRRPWSAFDPLFHPPPAQARGPFLDYPTLAAY